MTSRICWRAALVALLLPVLGIAATAPTWNPVWAQWLGALQGQYAFGVTQGSAYVVVSCAEFLAVFGTCFDNNPAAPYVMVQPPVGNDFVDPVYAVPFEQQITIQGGVPVPVTGSDPVTCAATPGCTNIDELYQLTDNDALVVIFSMPPQAAYFGYQSYVKTKYVGSGGTSPDPARDGIDGSIGNSVNDQVIATQTGASAFGTVAGQGPQVAIITTSNAALEQTLRSAFAALSADGHSTLLLTEPVWSTHDASAPGLVPTGSDPTSGDMKTMIRYVLPNPAYQAEASAWRAGVSSYLQVYRITAPSLATNNLLGPVSYTPKAGHSESSLAAPVSELAGLMNGYLASIQGKATSTALTVQEHDSAGGVPIGGLVGHLCIANDGECLSDTEDTDAYRIAPLGQLSTGKTFFVVGVNHTLTNNATYVSVAVNDATISEGIASVTTVDSAFTGYQSGTLGGSAKAALQSFQLLSKASARLKAALPQLYVAMATRNACQPGLSFCVQIGTTSGSGIPYADRVAVIERAYLVPGTTTGGNPNLLQDGIVVH